MNSEVPSANKVISPAKKQLFIVIIIVASASIVAIIGNDLVEYLVDTWCDLNSEVLDELWQKISEEPFLNYFA